MTLLIIIVGIYNVIIGISYLVAKARLDAHQKCLEEMAKAADKNCAAMKATIPVFNDIRIRLSALESEAQND